MSVFTDRQQEIAERVDNNAVKSHWRDWRWQHRHAIKSIQEFSYFSGIRLAPEKRKMLEQTLERFPLSITPYYLSLIDVNDYENDPVFLQAFPSPSELMLNHCDMIDPLSEDKDSPAPGITHRYPDRVLFHISNVCAMYCRHCTRKRKVGDHDNIPGKHTLQLGIDYIARTPQVRDVLLSGGDPFMLADSYLDWILTEIRKIRHVEIVRIGTRIPENNDRHERRETSG